MDLVITWPKRRSLQSYLAELDKAERYGQLINFRLGSKPKLEQFERCYMVHDGAIRGWNEVIAVEYKPADTVRDPFTGGYWPGGTYIVRHPFWHPVDPIPMKGFQGYRYYVREIH